MNSEDVAAGDLITGYKRKSRSDEGRFVVSRWLHTGKEVPDRSRQLLLFPLQLFFDLNTGMYVFLAAERNKLLSDADFLRHL
ncbi:hypothetical protein [Undibacterium luofuense]|uniref:hypothetical protein n=1 Tax=Undibacterium luofuense TaxID=2828733 RepID=UPI0030EE753D